MIRNLILEALEKSRSKKVNELLLKTISLIDQEETALEHDLNLIPIAQLLELEERARASDNPELLRLYCSELVGQIVKHKTLLQRSIETDASQVLKEWKEENSK